MSRYVLVMHTPLAREPYVAGPFSWKAALGCASLVRRAGLPVQVARYSSAVALTLRDVAALDDQRET